MTIHIYAEHLLNIRTLTIQVSLTTPSNAGTKATISADGGTLSVSHEGETASITLPVIIAGESAKALQIPAAPTSDLSFRLRLDDGAGALQTGQSGETIIPWTAASLSDQLELQCKKCNAVVLPRDQIQTWKDLPSEGWAEMMEFWHCHKPNEPHDHDHQTDKKGYSADSSLAITPSVGLVNATNFILAAEDCENIKVGHWSDSFHVLASRHSRHPRALKEPTLSGCKAILHGRVGILLPKKKPSGAEPVVTPAQAKGSLAMQCPLVLAVSLPDLEVYGFGRDVMHRYIPMYHNVTCLTNYLANQSLPC